MTTAATPDQADDAYAESERQRHARRRSQARLCFAILGGLALVAGFSHPVDLAVAVALLGYALYLHRGGKVVIWGSLRPRVRSRAWVYYTVIAVGATVFGFSHPALLLIAAVAGIYAAYLYRGGRFVLWIW